MQETFVHFSADIETARILDDLVASGILEELVAFSQDDRCFRLTPKGAQFLTWSQGLIPEAVHGDSPSRVRTAVDPHS